MTQITVDTSYHMQLRMPVQRRIEIAAARKTAGNEHFKAQKWVCALEDYTIGFQHVRRFHASDRKEVAPLRNSLALNIAAACLKLKNNKQAVEITTELLSTSRWWCKKEEAVKASYRRGVVSESFRSQSFTGSVLSLKDTVCSFLTTNTNDSQRLSTSVCCYPAL